jgi:5'-phosphate synthase pdxT subunit
MVFIRAPRITRVGAQVKVLATLEGEPVLVRHANVTGATFHPELAGAQTGKPPSWEFT